MVGSGGGLYQPSWKGGAPVISWQYYYRHYIFFKHHNNNKYFVKALLFFHLKITTPYKPFCRSPLILH